MPAPLDKESGGTGNKNIYLTFILDMVFDRMGYDIVTVKLQGLFQRSQLNVPIKMIIKEIFFIYIAPR